MFYRKQSDFLVWQFFVVCDDPSKAKCKCGKVYKSALHFWKTQCQIFPQLAELALQYLSAPISSVASEREFKVVRDLANGNRTRLKSANVQKLLLFLKHNVKAIGYNIAVLIQNSEKQVAAANVTIENKSLSEDDYSSDEL